LKTAKCVEETLEINFETANIAAEKESLAAKRKQIYASLGGKEKI